MALRFTEAEKGKHQLKDDNVGETTPTPASDRQMNILQEENPRETSGVRQGNSPIPTMEEVMEELHNATRRYLNYPDPVEAAARRQRVLHGDANGEMEDAAAGIIKAAREKQNLARRALTADSNPVTPPPLQFNPLPTPLSPERFAEHSPTMRGREELDLAPCSSEAPIQRNQTNSLAGGNGPARLSSIIVSPILDRGYEIQASIEAEEAAMGEEPPLGPQNKKKYKPRNTARTPRSPRLTPNILRGASSKKRNISQLNCSPGN
ncbi:unnamed protein product [Eruca vesicaria subsp. sativa]|uniref:Uncharacterized protein n=1 Tax=Eruca vesicaria subsp. sativa TaxID=29727 RepID=A0ABC8JFG9_ERUVS|nr:unnamed protein product [Eruca vesicaria subsp. sativa]